jgi:PPM family protein phosphatase
MIYRAFGRSDIGKLRQKNEDNFIIVAPEKREAGLYVVSDGVGGARGGDRASEMAITELEMGFLQERAAFDRYDLAHDQEQRNALLQLVNDLVVAANGAIYATAQSDEQLRGMATTIVALVAAERGAFIGHVGDSRIYLLRGDQVYRVTEDHTWAGLMVKAGRVPPSQVADHPYAHVLARSLGAAPHVEVDTAFVQVEPGDRFLLCTDGLHRYFPGRDILEVSRSSPSLTDLVEKLIREANGRGGRDNITVIAVEADRGAQTIRTVGLQEEIKLLQQLFLFEKLTDQEVMRVMRIMYKRTCPDGEVIIREGEEGHAFFIVVDGEVSITLRGKPLTTLRGGDHFGELALLDNEVRSATATAKGEVSLLEIKRKDFAALVQEDAQLALKLLSSFLAVVSRHVRTLSKELVSLSSLVGVDSEATIVELAMPTIADIDTTEDPQR